MPDALDSDPFERWHQAWFVAPLELFGYRCAPVCLGHLIYLQALASPILQIGIEDVGLSLPDILRALKIFAQAAWPFQSAIDFTPSPGDELLLAQHEAAISIGETSPVFAEFERLFVPWWFGCQIGPELFEEEDPGSLRTITAPFALASAVRLMRANFSETRAFTMHIGLLRFYAAALSEQEGGTAFVTPENIAAMREAAALPDLTQASDEELYALTVRERGQPFADEWLAERHKQREALAQLTPEETDHGRS